MMVAIGIAWLLFAVYGFVDRFDLWPLRGSDGERAASRSRKRGHARLRRGGGPSGKGPGMAARTPAPPYPLEMGDWDA